MAKRFKELIIDGDNFRIPASLSEEEFRTVIDLAKQVVDCFNLLEAGYVENLDRLDQLFLEFDQGVARPYPEFFEERRTVERKISSRADGLLQQMTDAMPQVLGQGYDLSLSLPGIPPNAFFPFGRPSLSISTPEGAHYALGLIQPPKIEVKYTEEVPGLGRFIGKPSTKRVVRYDNITLPL